MDWLGFERVDIDDVSVNDHIKVFRSELKSKFLLTKTGSGPVFARLIKKLLPKESTKPDKMIHKFSVAGVIIQITKDKHVDLLRTISGYNIPLLGVSLNSITLSEKTLN